MLNLRGGTLWQLHSRCFEIEHFCFGLNYLILSFNSIALHHARWEIAFEFMTISFFDSVEGLDDELDENKDEEGGLFFFSHLDLDFFRLFFVSFLVLFRLLFTSGLDEGEFIFPFLDLCRLSCFLAEEVSRFCDTIFAGLSCELSPALSFFALPHHWS